MSSALDAETTPTPPSTPTRLELYKAMVRVRSFEKRAYDLFLQNLVKGTSHLSLGQEAIAAGFAVAMRLDDYSYCTYRGHAHTLLRGAPLAALMGELMGRATGILGGKGGSMHLTSVEHYAMGSYAIVGSHLPIAVGAALSAQYRGSDQVSVCFFGDGATNIGAFHEALNLAAVWRLPVVFVCENNMYMEYTPISSVTSVPHPAADRAASYGLAPILIDGNDPDVVYQTASEALDRARNEEGPSLIEAETYRHGGHSRADPAHYRPREEVESWMERDPLTNYRARLAAIGVSQGELDAIDRQAEAEIDRATHEAMAGPEPDVASAEKNLWYDGSASWRN